MPAPPKLTQVKLTSAVQTTAFLAFGADSKVLPAAIPECAVTAPLNCELPIKGSVTLANPEGLYLNVTIAFGAPVGCGATKAEVNVNNPAWFDTLDVSLVDGYSTPIAIDYTPPGGSETTLGPPRGPTGNEKIEGVFPLGCDICTARQNPPCGMTPGTEGCKSGTQYKPDVPCQFQGVVKGGGGLVEVYLPPNWE